ncbi:MAG: hypothetical protein ACOYOU_03420 [Kiritimatiellia bacterium]
MKPIKTMVCKLLGIANQPPKIGDTIDVADSDLCHGTFEIGGSATVDQEWLTEEKIYVSVAEVRGTSWLWSTDSGLAEKQDEIRRWRPGKAGRTMMRMNDGKIVPFGPKAGSGETKNANQARQCGGAAAPRPEG